MSRSLHAQITSPSGKGLLIPLSLLRLLVQQADRPDARDRVLVSPMEDGTWQTTLVEHDPAPRNMGG